MSLGVTSLLCFDVYIYSNSRRAQHNLPIFMPKLRRFGVPETPTASNHTRKKAHILKIKDEIKT